MLFGLDYFQFLDSFKVAFIESRNGTATLYRRSGNDQIVVTNHSPGRF